jgi:hypothetical protein
MDLDLSHFDRQSLSEGACRHFAEAASVVIDRHGHPSPVKGRVTGDKRMACTVKWLTVDDIMIRTHADIQDATEAAAYGIAVWATPHLSPYECWERSQKGPGFDFWLRKRPTEEESEDEFNFLEGYDARLEVSGIAAGPERIGARIQTKLKQLAPSDRSGKPGFVFIAEFSEMVFHFQQKKAV